MNKLNALFNRDYTVYAKLLKSQDILQYPEIFLTKYGFVIDNRSRLESTYFEDFAKLKALNLRIPIQYIDSVHCVDTLDEIVSACGIPEFIKSITFDRLYSQKLNVGILYVCLKDSNADFHIRLRTINIRSTIQENFISAVRIVDCPYLKNLKNLKLEMDSGKYLRFYLNNCKELQSIGNLNVGRFSVEKCPNFKFSEGAFVTMHITVSREQFQSCKNDLSLIHCIANSSINVGSSLTFYLETGISDDSISTDLIKASFVEIGKRFCVSGCIIRLRVTDDLMNRKSFQYTVP